MTPIQRLRGRTWKIPLPEFAEKVEFMKKTPHKFKARFEDGVYLGVKLASSEKIVVNEKGLFVVQSIRRKPINERWDADLIDKIRGLPWKLKPDDDTVTELPHPIEIRPERPEVENEPTDWQDKPQQLRKTYITKGDLEDFGYTKGCPACAATAGGYKRDGTLHTQACRKRIEERMMETEAGKEKLKKTEEK